MKDWTPEERALFEESRRLKEKARGLVAKRTAAAQRAARDAQLRRKQEAERKAELDRVERMNQKLRTDARIRSALLRMAEAVKANGLAFEAPDEGQVIYSFTLIDKQYGQIGKRYKINATPTGFQWD